MLRGMQRIVYLRADGLWANKREGAAKAGTVHGTQREAEAAARRMLERAGGGELTLMGENHRIRSKDTIGEGNDPSSRKDTEH